MGIEGDSARPGGLALIVRAPHPTRLLFIVVNVAIVLYLGRRALGHARRAQRGHGAG